MTAQAAERAARAQRWERATDWPLIIAGIVFLAAYAIPILKPDLPRGLLEMCRWLTLITWAIFVIDYVVRVFLADQRLRYVLRRWYDALVVLLPLLRPPQLLRLIPLLLVINRRARAGCGGGWRSMSRAERRCWLSAQRLRSSTPSDRIQTPTSKASATQRGGRSRL
jgi:hypothetical protein